MSRDDITEEFLIQEYWVNNKTQYQIGVETNTNQAYISSLFKKFNIQARTGGKIVNLAGQHFGKLTVLSPVFKKDSEYKTFRWRCQCECGKIVDIRRSSLIDGTKSCGCVKQDNIGNLHHNWKGYGDIPGNFYSRYKQHAKRRKIEYNLSLEYLDALFKSQNGKCAISGLPLSFEHYGYKFHLSTASLDRKDSGKGYIEGNVQWVHKDIDFMKQSFEQNYFIKLCAIIAYNNE